MLRLEVSALLRSAHGLTVGNRRARVLATHIADAIPQRGTVLAVGCGEERVALALARLRPDLGVEILDSPAGADASGMPLPAQTAGFDHVALIDVLHCVPEPALLLAEAARVARTGIVVKDHFSESALDDATLQLMHRAGRLGVPARAGMPVFLSREDWQALFYRGRLATLSEVGRLGLYPPPLTWLCDRGLHFVALLAPRGSLS